MKVLNSILFWTACGTKMTQISQLATFPVAELNLNGDCGPTTSDGRFSDPTKHLNKQVCNKKRFTLLSFLHPVTK
jgi:hypothetical protein